MSSIPQENFDFVKGLNDLRQESIGCDVIIQVGQRSFFAHRIVLIHRMKYFRSLLTFDMLDRQQLIVPVDPEIVKPEIFGQILDYVYVFKADFTPENFEPICKAADYFCFDELLDKAKDFMKKNVEEKAVQPLMNLAIGNSSQELEEECEKLLISNPSSEIARKLLISSLSVENLKALIIKFGALWKHEDAFNYCMEWILHDPAGRKDRMAELLGTIPLERLSVPFIKEVVLKNQTVSSDAGSLKLLASSLANNKNSSTRLFVLGGKDGITSALSSVSQYNPKADEWSESTPMKDTNSLFAIAVKGQKIYVCGGWNGKEVSNGLKVFDTATNEWKELRPMDLPRTNAAAAVLNNYIYVAGGKADGNYRVWSVERYSIATGQWQEMAPLNYGRSGLELVEVGGYLYAIGGYARFGRAGSVERYDPTVNEWTMVADMNNKMELPGSTVLGGKIYVADEKTFEVYDPLADVWKVLPSPSQCVWERRLATISGRIYSIGGKDQWDHGVKTVEYFDADKQEWIRAEDMDIARGEHCVAVVHDC